MNKRAFRYQQSPDLQFNRFSYNLILGFVLVEFFFAESNQNSRSGILFLKIFNCELKEINFIPMCFR